MGESDEIREALSQLGTLTDLINERVSMHEEMRELKVDIQKRRHSHQYLLKTDVGDLKSDVRGFQTSRNHDDTNTMKSTKLSRYEALYFSHQIHEQDSSPFSLSYSDST